MKRKKTTVRARSAPVKCAFYVANRMLGEGIGKRRRLSESTDVDWQRQAGRRVPGTTRNSPNKGGRVQGGVRRRCTELPESTLVDGARSAKSTPPRMVRSGLEANKMSGHQVVSTISTSGGPLEDRTAGGSLSSLSESRIARTTLASIMVAITRIRPLQPGHLNASIPSVRWSNSAHSNLRTVLRRGRCSSRSSNMKLWAASSGDADSTSDWSL